MQDLFAVAFERNQRQNAGILPKGCSSPMITSWKLRQTSNLMFSSQSIRMAEVDYIRVGRVAHELGALHGPPAARLHALELVKQANDGGNPDDKAFWEAVAISLAPR
jgi:hypothetical protein